MFEFIKGNLEEILEDGIVIENQGIAYKIHTSRNLLDKLPKINNTVKVYLHGRIRDEEMLLYGFLDKEERNVYMHLTSVSGVGPKAAMAILSLYTSKEVIWSIIGEDTKVLIKAPGIGKKIAQRVILELKDKFNVEDSLPEGEVNGSIYKSEVKDEALNALIALGYHPSKALKAINKVYKEEMQLEKVIKESLKVFASK